MRKSTYFACVLILICLTSVQAGAISLSMWSDAPTLNGNYLVTLGETYTLFVDAQVKSGYASADNGIFGWDVDLRIEDPAVLSLLPETLDRSGWTGNSSTSSNGTKTPWGLDAIYDTGEGSMDLGVEGSVRLFSVDFTCLSVGESVLKLEPDYSIGADFVTWGSDLGGDYSAASVSVTATAVPEPASVVLLSMGFLTLLCRRRIR